MEDLHTSDLPEEAILPEPDDNKRYPFWLLVVLLLAYALRVFLLDEQSIWWDEGISLHLAVSSITELLADRLSNIHPPLYFMVLKGWLSLVGVSAFSARYLSVLASWLQVVVIYVVAHRWFSRRTGTAAALLAALSAVSILYGQEIRVYAMLALIYLLLLAVTGELTRPSVAKDKRRVRLWAALGLITWIGLHLHYIVSFVAVYVSAWALLVFIRQRRWVDLRRWLIVMYLVGLASVPWFFAVLLNWATVKNEVVAGTFGTDPAPITFLLSQVWVFHLTGLAGALVRPGVGLLVGVSVLALLLLVLIRLGQKGTRRDTALLLAHWLIPLSSALVVWTIRSFSHPRYVSMFAPGLILLVAYMVYPPREKLGQRLNWLSSPLSLILFLAIILSSLMGLWLYFFVPDVAKDDVRGVARYLEEKAEVEDLILIPDTDWSLPFEYTGDATLSMPGLNDPDRYWSKLGSLSYGVDRAYLVDYQNGTRDWQQVLPFALGKAGFKVAEREFDGLVVETYHLDEMISAPAMRSEDARFGPLELRGSWVEQDGLAGDAFTLALQWHLSERADEKIQISLRLLDKGAWSVAEENTLLLDAYGRPTDQWLVEQPITTYHVISIPPAVPPLAYAIELQAYVVNGSELEPLTLLDAQGAPEGENYPLGKTHVAYYPGVVPINQAELPLKPWAESVQVAPELALLSGDIASGTALSGQSIDVFFLWQAMAEFMPELLPEVAVVQGEKDLVVNSEVPVYGRYPTHIWTSGEQVFERRSLQIPLDASGEVEVVLRLGDDKFVLGSIEIGERYHNFDQPTTAYSVDATFGDVARLTGFDLPKTTFADGETIPVTLAWESLVDGSSVEYVVFAHLLADDGHLVGQHDSPPVNGSRSTAGWISGEYISDEHEMSLRESGYQGQARIEVGLYDPDSGERLLLSNGSDHVILPVIITIESP